MGKIVFFSILLLSIIAAFVYVVSKLRKAKAATGGEEKKKSKSWLSDDTRELVSIFTPLLVGVMIVITPFWLTVAYRGLIRKNVEPTKINSTIVKPPCSISVIQHGTISWCKPRGVTGRNPRVRKDSLKVEMYRNDSKAMEFVAEYIYGGKTHKAYFKWNKCEKYGTWSQSCPNDGGVWFLQQRSSKVFMGEHSDKTGSVMPIRLELL